MGPERAFPARWGEVWSKTALKARDLKLVRTVATAAGIKECRDACTVLGSALRGLPSGLSHSLLPVRKLRLRERKQLAQSPTARNGRDDIQGAEQEQDTSDYPRCEPGQRGRRQGECEPGDRERGGILASKKGISRAWDVDTGRSIQRPVHPASNAMLLTWMQGVPRGSLGAI